MRRCKEIKQIQKVLTEYGLTILEGNHRRIVNEKGQPIYWTGGSPGDYNFTKQIIRDLVRMQLIPESCKKRI